MSQYLEKSRNYKGFHYSVLSDEMIEYLHKTTLNMLSHIIPVFEANNIRYMICGGTLLGAVTSGKFIPWDDDVDLCVLEDDYDMMIEVLEKSLPEWIEVQCSDTEPNYYHGWIKVRDKYSHVYPDIAGYHNNGVWIDIYKLNKVKRVDVPGLIACEHLDYLHRRYEVGEITEDEMVRRIKANDLETKIADYKYHALSGVSEDEVYIIWSASKIIVDIEWVFPRERYCFEGINLYSFKNAEQYLVNHYGQDYSNLPPDDMRRVGINKIDFCMD